MHESEYNLELVKFALGHPVIDLVRRQFGPLNLGSLAVGRTRDLTKVELGQLLTIAREAETEQKGTDRG
jgi:23S rRNA pseudouridine2605 synthase/16S rRNA pseudouridine516 synthase